MILNQWTKITHWCPAQLFYYFKDADSGHWCIYLRWDGQRGDEPWTAELMRCNENWEFCWDSPDNVNLLEEKSHTPGTVTGYYYDKEYQFLQDKVLDLVKERFPDLEFPQKQQHNDILTRIKTTNNGCGIPSGFPSLDNITGGWQQSNLIVIASRPQIGKTAFAMNLARNVAVCQHNPVALFSLDISAIQFAKRLIVQETGVGKEAITGFNTDVALNWLELEDRRKTFSDAPLFVDDTSGLKLAEFKEKAKQLVEENGVRLIVIDYVQLMQGPEGLRGQREEELSFILRELKATAKELHVPIIALAQLSRVFGKDIVRRPQTRDFFGSSRAFEEHSDLIILIHRPDCLGLSEDTKEICELIVAKNINGDTGVVSLRFNTSSLNFCESEENRIPE